MPKSGRPTDTANEPISLAVHRYKRFVAGAEALATTRRMDSFESIHRDYVVCVGFPGSSDEWVTVRSSRSGFIRRRFQPELDLMI